MSTQEFVILVDENDNPIGTQEKIAAHERAELHRAFSVFIYRQHDDELQVLLQQRNFEKYHCGGLWTNTCCGHPRPGEETVAAAQRRLHEEMGIHVQLKEIGVFTYKSEFTNGLTEHEIDHVMAGTLPDTPFTVNPEEVADFKWVSTTHLKKDIDRNTAAYTPWLSQALEIFIQHNTKSTP